MPGAPMLLEPDDLGDDEYNSMDPAGSSPLVAWLASDEAGHITGQVIRAINDRIVLMNGWSNDRGLQRRETLGCDQARPDPVDRPVPHALPGFTMMVTVQHEGGLDAGQ